MEKNLNWFARRIRARVPIPTWQTMRGGYQMHLRPTSDPLERRLYVVGDYEPAVLALMDEIIEPGSTVVDVGANLGLMTLHAAKLAGPTGKVVAVEAHPVYFERLTRNVARNRYSQVQLVNAAAGAKAGEAKIFDFPDVNIGRSSLIDFNSTGHEAGSVKVKTLDSILGPEKPIFVKIDVEGFEREVIAGATKTLTRARPVVCMEVNDDQTSAGGDHRSAHDLLMSLGTHDCYRFKDSKFSSSPALAPLSRDQLTEFHDNVIYLPK